MKLTTDIKSLLIAALLTLSMALFGTAAFADSHAADEGEKAMEEATEETTEAAEEGTEETEEAAEEATEEAPQ